MTYTVVGIAVVAVAAVVVALRASRRRAAALDAALLDALAERASGQLAVTEAHVGLTAGGHAAGSFRLLRSRLRSAARKHQDLQAVAGAAARLLEQPLGALDGSLSLKIHGTRIGLHFVSPIIFDLLPTEPQLARRQEPDLGLSATYRVEGRASGCLSEDHLQDQAIDTTDVHGIALAVLRQRFDESLVTRLIEGQKELVESKDGTAAALILVLPDFLPTGCQVLAELEDEDRLILEPWVEQVPDQRPGPRSFLVDNQGWRLL